MLHTLQEALKLTGISRRTLYNHCDAGLVTYSIGPNGRRLFETSELQRVYGNLHTKNVKSVQASAHNGTQSKDSDQDERIRVAVEKAIEPLQREIAELKALVLRLEHKPEGRAPATKKASVPVSFSDLLATLDE